MESSDPGNRAGAAPDDFEALRRRLHELGEALPRRLRQVADFALNNPDEMAFSTVARVAGAAGVQPSTVVRFAKALGFAGFSQLQALFRRRLRGDFPDYRERIAAAHGAAGDAPLALLEGFAASATHSIERLRATIDPQTLERCVAILAQAQTIHLLGARRVFPVAAYLAYTFGKLGLRAALVDQVAALGPEQMALAGPGDAVLAITFTPYAQATIELAGAAAKAGAPIVAITDSPFSPLAGMAQAWIEVAETDLAGFRSLSASMALALALAVAVAERRRAGARS